MADNPFSSIFNQTTNQQEAGNNPFSQIYGQNQQQDPWQNFTQLAQKTIEDMGLPQSVLPVLLGQAAIESGRGKAAPNNNYFGIKGEGNAGSANLPTQEYGQGGYYNTFSNFASYNSPQDSINAYLDLIQGYKGVPEAMQSNDPDSLMRAIEANGYATSPNYVNEVESTPEFQQYATGGQQ